MIRMRTTPLDPSFSWQGEPYGRRFAALCSPCTTPMFRISAILVQLCYALAGVRRAFPGTTSLMSR